MKRMCSGSHRRVRLSAAHLPTPGAGSLANHPLSEPHITCLAGVRGDDPLSLCGCSEDPYCRSRAPWEACLSCTSQGPVFPIHRASRQQASSPACGTERKLDRVAHSCDSSPWDWLAGGSRAQGQLGPHTKFRVSLENTGRHHLKNKQAKREEEEEDEEEKKREGRREERISPGYPLSSLQRCISEHCC